MNLQHLYTLRSVCKNLLKKEKSPQFRQSLTELLFASEGEIETIEHPPHAPNINSLPVQIVNKNRDGSPAQPIDYGQIADSPPDIDLDNYNTLNQWVTTWMHWLRMNAPLLNADFDVVPKHEAYDMEKFTRPVARPDLVALLGSGPSLEANAPFLKTFPGYIICGPSNASACVALGAPPHAILAIDSGMGTVNYLQGIDYNKYKTILITSPTINTEAAKLFNTRLWFLSLIQLGKGAQHPFNIYQKLLYDNVESWMFQAGCTVNAELLQLHMIESWYEKQFAAVYLLGVDFAFFPGRARIKNYKELPDGTFQETFAEKAVDVPISNLPLRRAANGMISDEAMIGYKRSLLTIWQITQQRIYDCSSGIITELPKRNFQEETTNGYPGATETYISQEDIFNTYRKYMLESGYVEGKASGLEGSVLSDDLQQDPF
jgi:hypothetical protein